MAYPTDKSYKIVNDLISEGDHIITQRGDTQISIPRVDSNGDYQQFLQNVKEQGIGIVEGPDIITKSYAILRSKEYPSLTDQQDMQYWDAVNGTTTWKDKINEIKTKYPKTITGGSTVGDIPAWVQTEVDKLNS